MFQNCKRKVLSKNIKSKLKRKKELAMEQIVLQIRNGISLGMKKLEKKNQHKF